MTSAKFGDIYSVCVGILLYLFHVENRYGSTLYFSDFDDAIYESMIGL